MNALPSPGTLLSDRYRLLDELGRGGMGVVFRAEHTLLGRLVAIKVLSSHGAEFLERFKREARLLARIDHPGVCGVMDFGVTPEGAFFLVMEFLDGMTLDRVLLRDRRLPVRQVIAVFRQVAEALAHCHTAGIVHRDLKPENIMLPRTPEIPPGSVRILDFGIAVSTQPDAQAPRVTRAGIVLGTPAFMSPEQATGGQVDARSDLYAVGVMMYEAITGTNPFEAGDALKTMAAQAHHLARPMAEAAPDLDIPPELELIVARLLAKDRAARIQTADELARALGALERGEPSQLTRPQPALPSAHQPTVLDAKGSSSTRRAWLLGIGIVALAGLIGAVVLLSGTDTPVVPAADTLETVDPALPPIAPVEGLTFTAHTIARRIVDRRPEGVATTFPSDVNKVYCHILVDNSSDLKQVTAVWYFRDEERSRIDLRIGKSPRWNTFAVTPIDPKRTGPWRCDILGPDGQRLSSASFEIR
jgi:serine/threonine protein kinase